MTAIVADASVALKWFVRESDSDVANRILAAPVIVHAPSLLRPEFLNGLWKQWRKKFIAADQAEEAATLLERTIGCWHEDAPLLESALKLSLSLDHPIYDCLYMALAQKLSAPVVTADRRLLAVAPKNLAVALEDWTG